MSSISIDLPNNCPLPPNVSESALVSGLIQIAQVVGRDNVDLVDFKGLDFTKNYHDPSNSHDGFPLLAEDELVASAVVYPGSTEDVVAIVKIANEFKIPIWPISRGRNFGYGAAGPRVRGSVVVDLGRRMDKILEINEENAWCRVQPGVSYQMLYDELQKRGSRLWVDVPDLGGGSLLANALERGGGYTPYQDHFGTHSGLEVVLPTGKLVRTGAGAIPNKNNDSGSASTWSSFPYGYGPFHDGIFTQSNFGIVTSIGIMLMPDPGGYQFFQVSFEKDEDLPKIIDLILPLKTAGAVMAGITIRPAILDLAVRHPKSYYSSTCSDEPLTEEELESARKKTHLGKWSMYGAAYGPKEMQEMQIQLIKDTFLSIPGAKFYTPQDVPKEDNYTVIHIREETLRGVPSVWEYNWVNFLPNGACGFVSPFTPGTSRDAMKSFEISKRRFKEHGLDLFGTWVIVPRGVSWLSIAVYDKTKPEQKDRAYKCLQEIVADNASLGYGLYRSHVAMMDQAANTYNWGEDRFGGSIMALNELLKDSLDPNGILAPGKSGIWPRAYRNGSIVLTQALQVPHATFTPKL